MALQQYYVIADKDCTLTFKNGSTDATLAEVAATAANLVTVQLDSSVAPYVVADRSDVECGRKPLTEGLNKLTIAYSLTAGGVNDASTPVEFELLANDVARLAGRVNFATGNPSSILQLDSQYYPIGTVPVTLYAMTTGSFGITCGSIGLTGILSVADAVGGVSSARDVQFDTTFKF